MSRNLPWLAELQPEMFVELDPVLAQERGIEDGGWMCVMTARGEIEARAKVTHRIRPLEIGGRTVHQISMPWHWGTFKTNEQGVTGDTVNDIVVLSGDPNVSIEDKSFSCDVRPGRRHGQSTARLAHAADDQLNPLTGDHGAEEPDKAGQTSQAAHEPPPGPS
jgi:formate dehydrogenase major subunit